MRPGPPWARFFDPVIIKGVTLLARASAREETRRATAATAATLDGYRFDAVPVPPIAWTQTYAVRILDQRLLPGELVERDLETADATADAIRTLAVRGAPLIGIAAAMGLVAGLRAHRHDARETFLDAQARLTRLLEAARPTAVNLRWALDRQRRATLATPGEGDAL